ARRAAACCWWAGTSRTWNCARGWSRDASASPACTARWIPRCSSGWCCAPAQDMRSKDNAFVPFFGVPAATITATHHLARLSGSAVVPFFHRRLPDSQGYALRLGAPLEHFPGPSASDDTARINACIEQMVREAPEQYLWVHKRFKTRPPGAPRIY